MKQKYSEGEFVEFKEYADKPSIKGVITGKITMYNMYQIQSVEDYKRGHILLVDESDILYSLNRYIVKWYHTKDVKPDKDGWYLGTMLYMQLGHPITIPVYYKDSEKAFISSDGEKFFISGDYPDVFAWMPLPDPYKEDERGKWDTGFRKGESKGFDKGLDSIDIDP